MLWVVDGAHACWLRVTLFFLLRIQPLFMLEHAGVAEEPISVPHLFQNRHEPDALSEPRASHLRTDYISI